MSDYRFPQDEFDQPAGEGQSVGIHRSQKSAWSKVWPFLAVIVVFALLALGVVWWFANNGTGSLSGQTTTPAAVETSGDDATSAEGESSDAETTEPAEETATEEPPAEETTEPPATAELDRAVAIRVLNATNTAGLAADGVTRLTDAGWTDATADNYTGGAVSSTTVWYQSADFEAEAQAVAADLGVSDVQLVPSLVGPVSVILASDFSG